MTSPHPERPLSPHLSIYRWQITNTMSILHRITGVALALGLLLMSAWLIGEAFCPAIKSLVDMVTGSLLGKLLLIGWSAAFYYHLSNGLRHLQWDRVKGMSIAQVTRSGKLAIAFTVGMTALTWIIILTQAGI